ncbi:hypothetical protein HBH56_148750 [Parastagonospora nodorum]|uniref:Uncharacterized protein n=1 Tax=Phaeosphaeria nodorum (strain SN15 / ATCC MYA-4574 / FGSC 10173) TaxID=321614 RepID=A0A7U2EWI7_PHANO|nr:hypothetical protein HBH56_148750 [Parastagonospora nodorum]QRC94131.1 hypothetical protein JI435_405220 [Parastagonospora nodorum SN15]KAH3923233.1 hypothetical protein HBH54_213390 [Parastagonospora nodorum]KAH4003706.1 hypothetical protein HBI10_061770 [Parastagonospora nodorum]KAH4028808.1 hypothetical protein HBI13_040620 [Parastagonospora nodorum]
MVPTPPNLHPQIPNRYRPPKRPPQKQKERARARLMTQPRFELGTFSVRGRVPC